jgi:uncharacterized membrane protein
MTTTTLHPAAAAYLKRLRHVIRELPKDSRDDLLSDITAHLHEAIDVDATETEVRTVLDRLGSPEEIIAAQLSDTASPVIAARRTHEWAAIILLLLGGFALGVGWLIGLFLLWSSRAWTTTQKLLGTLIIPGGLASVPIVLLLTATKQICTSGGGFPTHCTAGPSTTHQVLTIILVAIAVIAPITTAIYLTRRAHRPN